MRHKVGDWVYTSIGRCPALFRCQVAEIREREAGFFRKRKEQYYMLKVPGQTWVFEASDNPYDNQFAAISEGEFYSR